MRNSLTPFPKSVSQGRFLRLTVIEPPPSAIKLSAPIATGLHLLSDAISDEKLEAKFKLSVDAQRMVGQNDSFTLTARVVLNHKLEIWALGKFPREDNNLEAIQPP